MKSPRICILSSEETPVLILDNNAPKALHYYSDSLHSYLTIGGASTFTFSVDSTHEEAHLIEAGMKIGFRFEDTDWYFTITSVDRDETETVITSEGLSFEFLNEEVDKFESPGEMTFLEYLDAWGFERDILKTVRNDIPTVKKKLKFDARESILKRMASLASSFGIEVRLSPLLTLYGGLKEIQMSLCVAGDRKGVGTDLTDQIIRWGGGPESIRKTTDLTEFCSRLRARGKTSREGDQDVTITLAGYTPGSSATDPDGYTYVLNSTDLCCPQARDRYPSSLTKNPEGGYIDGYVVRFFEDSNADTQEKLYQSTLAQLRKLCRPKVSYEVRGAVPGSIGDWLTVEDAAYAPIEYYQCRIIEKEVCVSTGEVTGVKLDNFTEISSKLSQSILSQIEEAMEKATIYDCRISSADGTAMDADGKPHLFSAIVRKNSLDVTSDMDITWYLDGTEVPKGDLAYQIRLDPESMSIGSHVLSFRALDGSILRGTAEVTLTRSKVAVEKLPTGDGVKIIMNESAAHVSNGKDGVGVSSVSARYYQSSSSSAPSQTSSSWSTTMPSSLTAGYYLHTQIRVYLTNGSVQYYYTKSRNGTNGSSSSVSVVNNLTSTSTTSALSAAQGKKLWDNLGQVIIKRDFTARCTTTGPDQIVYVSMILPSGYLPLAAVNVATNGFVSHFYVESFSTTTIRCWGNTQSGKTITVSMLFIRDDLY